MSGGYAYPRLTPWATCFRPFHGLTLSTDLCYKALILRRPQEPWAASFVPVLKLRFPGAPARIRRGHTCQSSECDLLDGGIPFEKIRDFLHRKARGPFQGKTVQNRRSISYNLVVRNAKTEFWRKWGVKSLTALWGPHDGSAFDIATVRRKAGILGPIVNLRFCILPAASHLSSTC